MARQLEVDDLIDWVGFTRDVEAQLAQMDLFVLPSLFGEGLPMVVLESMAAGVPVVATSVEGVPEAIRDGIDGLLVEPDDAGQLADAIRTLVQRSRGMADAALASVSTSSRSLLGPPHGPASGGRLPSPCARCRA